MMVLVLIAAPNSIKGFTGRYLTEISSGVFVGNVGRNIRESLWDFTKENLGRGGKAVMLFSTNNAQGFTMEIINFSDRDLLDFDGVTIVRRLNADRRLEIQKSENNYGKTGWSRASIYQKAKRNKARPQEKS